MDSTSVRKFSPNCRGRTRGMGRGTASPKPPITSRPVASPAGDSPSTSLATLGRGQGLLPRTVDPSPVSAMPLNFARGRGLGRSGITVGAYPGGAAVGSATCVKLEPRVEPKSVAAPAGLGAGSPATDGIAAGVKLEPRVEPKGVAAPVGLGTESPAAVGSPTDVRLETTAEVNSVATPAEPGVGPKIEAACGAGAAPPPPMAGNSAVIYRNFDSDSSEDSDQGDDLMFSVAQHRAMAILDSDDEDLMNIGRQLRQKHEDEREALPCLPAERPAPKSNEVDRFKAAQLLSSRLSKWRTDLREQNMGCLGPGRALEAALTTRWNPDHVPEVVAWLRSELVTARDPCACALALMNWCGRASPKKNVRKEVASRCLPRLEGALDCVESAMATSQDAHKRFLTHRTTESRRFAFFLGQREGLATLRRIVTMFRLDDDLVVDTMKVLMDKLLDGGVYKEACQFIGLLGLQQHYSPQQVLLPCIAEGRTILVEEYAKECDASQRQLLRFLDSNFDQPHFLRKLLENCHPEILQVRHDLLTITAMKKLTLRLQKLFCQPNSVIPRISGERCQLDLAWLLYERYIRRIDRSDWLTAIQSAVGDSHDNAVSLVENLIDYRLPGAARRWARFYGVANAEVPSLANLEGMEEEAAAEEEERELAKPRQMPDRPLPQADEHFLTFPLDAENDIEFVQEEDELWRAIGLASKADKIGFDAEWTTLYGQSEAWISLLQMSLRDVVFIFDMQRLPAAVEGPEVWHHFRTEIFEKNQTKIFYSAMQDLQMIWATVPELMTPSSGQEGAQPAASYRGVVDLEQLVIQCIAASCDFFPSGGPSGGLSGLVESCLGRPLNKTERMSNWRARPLTRRQTVYAALDAHCLISVHDWLEQRKLELSMTGLNLNQLADLEEKKKKKKKREENSQQN